MGLRSTGLCSLLGGGKALWRRVESEAFLKERALEKGWSCSSTLKFALDFRVEEALETAQDLGSETGQDSSRAP